MLVAMHLTSELVAMLLTAVQQASPSVHQVSEQTAIFEKLNTSAQRAKHYNDH